MSERAPSWDHHRSFLSVMKEGSLSAAARALGLTQPTLARHIGELERALGGVSLFTRSPQGLTPTAAARRLAPPCRNHGVGRGGAGAHRRGLGGGR